MPNTLIIPDEGLVSLLEYQIKSSISGVNPWSLRLFDNDFTPDFSSVLADFNEASFSGYGSVTMTRSDWTTPVVTSNHARSTWKTVATTWLVTSGTGTIYGCYYTDDDLGVVRGAFRFDVPIVYGPAGVIAVLPEFSYATEIVP